MIQKECRMNSTTNNTLIDKKLDEIINKKKQAGKKSFILGLTGIVCFLLLWQAVVSFELVNIKYFASPIQVIQAIIKKFVDESPDGSTLMYHVLASFQVSFTGFFLSIIIGAPLGLFMGWFKPVDKFVRPLFEIIRPIPPISWIPIAIVFLGIGVQAKAFIIFFSGFIPTLINSYTGIKMTNHVHVNVGKTCGASNMKIFFTIGVPSAMPMVFAGFKLSLGNAWSTLVAAEMLAANKGLGYMISMGRNFSRIDLVIAGMLIIGALGIMLSIIMDFIERKTLKWRYIK